MFASRTTESAELLRWTGSVNEMVEAVQGCSGLLGWCDALGDLCEGGNPVLQSILGGALAELATGWSPSRDVFSVLPRVCDESRAWCRSIPAPPSAGRSLRPIDHLHRSSSSVLDARTTSLSLMLGDPANIEGLLSSSLSMNDADRDRLSSAFSDAYTRSIRFTSGWPMEAKLISTPLQQIVDCSTSFQLSQQRMTICSVW
jgi:hypothetical protein